MECPRCATVLDGKPDNCGRCGFVIGKMRDDGDTLPAGRTPRCPRCGSPVRSGEYPRREPGRVSATPWNAGWHGACEQCGFEFSATHAQDSRDWSDIPISIQRMIRPIVGVQRRISVRPASDGYFQDRDVQLNLAGIEIKVENTSYGRLDRSEQYFLSKEEAAWLVRALQGPLGICFEQYHWDTDVT